MVMHWLLGMQLGNAALWLAMGHDNATLGWGIGLGNATLGVWVWDMVMQH